MILMEKPLEMRSFDDQEDNTKMGVTKRGYEHVNVLRVWSDGEFLTASIK
jgi:hypothetical protein